MLRTIVGAFTAFALTAQAPATAPVQPQPPSSPTCPEMATALTRLMGNDARLRDWPLLSRYRDANDTLRMEGNGNRVVFMGDSITDAWPARFASSFFPGKPYVGRGISGQTTPQMLIRFRPDVIALKPKAVVILAGTNDIAGNTGPMTDEEIEGNLQSMAELAKANGIKVILASITPTGAYHTATGAVPQLTLRPMARIKAINEWMKKYADKNGHVYVDYFSAMIDSTGVMKTELTTDDLHPNAAGYEIMAPLAQAAIDKALK